MRRQQRIAIANPRSGTPAGRAPARGGCRPPSASRRPSPMKASSTSARRHRRAAPRVRARARRPSPPPASRRWASGGVAASRRTARDGGAGRAPCATTAAATSQSAASREAGRLMRSSSRAAAQPNARVALVSVADHAVGGVDGLVERPARQARRARSRTTGATTPSEKFSARLSIAARATPASSRTSGSRPTTMRYSPPPLVEAPVEPVGDGADVGVEAALRRQARGQRRKKHETKGAEARDPPSPPRRPTRSGQDI